MTSLIVAYIFILIIHYASNLSYIRTDTVLAQTTANVTKKTKYMRMKIFTQIERRKCAIKMIENTNNNSIYAQS